MASGNYWDDAANKGSYNGETFYDKNKWLQASGYQKQGGGGDIRPYTGSYSAPGGYEDTIARQIALQQKANEPAVQALEASKAPLEQKYKDLIASIKGNQQVAENRQTVVTNSELGKRGLNSQTDTLAQQELVNNLNPITQQYSGMINDATNNSAQAQSDIALKIAQLRSGAASSGISQGLDIYSQDQARLVAQQQAEREAEARRQQQANLDRQYTNIDLPMAQYSLNKPYYKNTGSASGLPDLSLIFN